MIAALHGTVGERDGDTVVVHTPGGVGYAVTLSAGALERLPGPGATVSLYTELVVREDGWALYGFDRPLDRAVFQRLLGASGVGPKLALAVVSSLGAERTVRCVQNRDVAALSTVTGIGKKKAERLVVELSDRFGDLRVEPSAARVPGAEEAIRALVGLGYTPASAEEAVRAAAAGAPQDPAQLIRRALQQLAASRGR